jgi:hypothetical protein
MWIELLEGEPCSSVSQTWDRPAEVARASQGIACFSLKAQRLVYQEAIVPIQWPQPL